MSTLPDRQQFGPRRSGLRIVPLTWPRTLAGVRLAEVVGALEAPTSICRGEVVEVTDIAFVSSDVRPGSLFFCLPGHDRDGHDFAQHAVARGAVAIVCERSVDVSVPQIVVRDARRSMGAAASTLAGDPSHHMSVVGVTGTNGKTTTTYLIKACLEASGVPTVVIGALKGGRTTQESPLLQRRFADAIRAGSRAAAIEVSSPSLVAQRLAGTRFAVGVFTNLGHDHIGEVHLNQEDYFQAKALLFEPGLAAVGVANTDDPWGQRLLNEAKIPMTSFSLTDAKELDLGPRGSRFVWRGIEVRLPMPGIYNVANALAAASAVAHLEVDPAAIAAGLATVPAVPGHFEQITEGQDFHVIVDYAHTPEALDSCLRAARALTSTGRLIVVFGCGGGRDRSKRRLMGAAAGDLADMVVLTDDNPRNEDPEQIVRDIVEGLNGDTALVIEHDRAAAIAHAILWAGAEDVIVLAGKGAEIEQHIGEDVHPFNDKVVATEAISRLMG
jgi:UDP-N-acetylmuramoyl-L-alanyl-D-glutamate--2,6-diaminopimelate ligase